MSRNVVLEDGLILLDGEPRVFLCASLFPFRLPREQWADRIEGVKRLGYHFLDVIFPWNFHEHTPGVFDFTGARDVEYFLKLVADAGLLVLARPGPYICAEYDGAGYPAWLGLSPDIELRQNEPLHLAEVERWFSEILPILARHQITEGGAVAMVQLENELDFSACDDPAGYIAALKAMADRHGIVVPTITCAGQGDIERSNGGVPGVVPAANLYPDDDATIVEATTAHYAGLLREQGHPLIITESNRLHRTIKRMMIAGARFVGPYLQASSWNYDGSTSTNSWGSPYAFMSSDYDFGGVIAPDGTERPDAAAGRLLSALLTAFGARFAAATPGATTRVQHVPESVTTAAVDLVGGGQLVSLTNIGSSVPGIVVRHGSGSVTVDVPAGECLLLPFDLPVGGSDVLRASTAEVIGLSVDADAVSVTAHTSVTATFVWEVGEGATVVGSLGSTVSGGIVTLVGDAGEATITTASGRRISVRVDPTSLAGRSPAGEAPALLPDVVVESVLASDAAVRSDGWSAGDPANDAGLELERHGIYRGAGVYRASIDAGPVRGVLLGGASDVLSIRLGDVPARTVVNGGQDLFIDYPDNAEIDDSTLTVTAEIWGHSNFDDQRLPAMRLGSLRGITGGGVVSEIEDLTYGWWLSSPRGSQIVGTPNPTSTWGGWSSSERPQHIDYARQVSRREGELLALRIRDTQGVHDVALDGQVVGRITPLWPVLDLTSHLTPGESATLRISAVRTFDETFGSAELLRGRLGQGWTVAEIGTPQLDAEAKRDLESARNLSLPVELNPGDGRWIHLSLEEPAVSALLERDAMLRFVGDNVRMTVMHHGHLIARVWSNTPEGVEIRGGRGDIALVTAEWVRESPVVSVLVETVDAREGRLDAVIVSHRIDPAQ